MVIHSSLFFNSISPKIPLGFSDHQQAEVFLQSQKNPRKRKQVYLNTLSVLAVKFHLQYLGFDPQTEACESFDSVLQACFDVADLELPHQGKIECRPVLPGQDYMRVPPEVFEDRLAYIAVRLNRELTEAEILGFVEQVEAEMIPLSQLRSPEELFDFLQPVPFPRINLSDWLQNSIAQGWKTLDEIFPVQEPQLVLNFRSRDKRQGVKRGKLFQHQNNHFTLLMGVQPSDQEMQISVELYPTAEQSYLPRDLKVNILNETGRSIMEAIATQTKNIQMEFKGETGEPFSVQISLGQMCMIESFVI
ncbi:DUF1822 family protein [Roseofilum reptotaenium CS-1145]|uniref:DUF1822 domain-containing protein n=1 Tax=Roseofilum reptotaenium AO1-A TaxID=1925591 RepID=A0A1L9QPF8_9CYAN|nr:DUF1822 family protein [Roseofilum reptotaenium]MDB9519517.1 DUF1822 family protein [Roseofilum reptotaenium CS-1145]OJJ24522.1 hypothetical protein BI308_16040 [Roseofilum reptotaenium AO1-A]